MALKAILAAPEEAIADDQGREFITPQLIMDNLIPIKNSTDVIN